MAEAEAAAQASGAARARTEGAAAEPPPAGPLPSGRHRLTRAQVVGSQRMRMFAAMAEAMLEQGYAGTSVADIIRGAGVSRETFYQQFRSKQDCFVQALDAATEDLAGVLDPPEGPAAAPSETFRALLGRYLDALAERPALARLFLVEVYAAGPEAIERRQANQRRFADTIAALFGADTEDRRFACAALVAATAQLVTARLVSNDLDGLRALEAPLATLATRLLD
ncbi:TetR/AcrR family transcriptional regulator [Streptomyces sp. DSM 44917]|uniref:TetR/AcrR family transcriptional regulator n=1 Tax=Streptomyces boetiae TaxID=3075541 RepID=A0ABU2L3C4_9ACTN|nr:TetR/AcrR family transcriptional regulator [Streptomyces sp. DSM 44917]MDT0306059.1 TetR/AcrR family transcriptional regulator [Streptomyces sp. DSM 44917]